MKIELKYDGKNFYDPLFSFMWNDEKDDFGIGIRYDNDTKHHIDYQFVIDDIEKNFEKHEIKGTSFCYYTKENVYVFNLRDSFELIPRKKNFSHAVVLLDENGKIINGRYRQFVSEIL